ncbi:TRAP transporter large permease [Halarsenatibacter silvermanii]|uniref:TRAP transporter, DctM subunit n=1 Tax=Halarsenatibacter silvermanii TaxID=321763 RepID=A0A1G9ILW7_9FIRM|nr:TRAP transporter large permease [Halarsenatibacter silvermanii]SDL26258.1 TRAP transporter, DctM subunit [Halarsenatibacter silvermanii]
MDILLYAAVFIILIIIKLPIAFVLGITGLFALLHNGYSPTEAIRQIYSGIDSFTLMAIPFFIFAGQIMNEGDITDRLLNISEALVGWIRGSLGHVNVVASILFAGISGAAVSDTAALGSMLIPAMEKKGYSRSYSSALTAASSIIGPTIPPSIPIIVYGGSMDISIAGLFAAGVLPGVFLGLIMMFINYYYVKKYDYERKADRLIAPDEEKVYGLTEKVIKYLLNFLKSLQGGIWALIMFLIIFGGILGGIFTATEAAGVAAAYAVIATFAFMKTLDLRGIWGVFMKVGSMTGMAMLIVSTGRIISHFFAMEDIPQMLSQYIMGLTTTDWVFMLICAVFLLFVGTFMDLIASIIILGPVLTPIAIEFGIHPYHFGLLFVFTLNVALITPPVGAVLFVVSAIGKTDFEDLVKDILPFYFAFILTIIVIIFFEPITLYIPYILGL